MLHSPELYFHVVRLFSSALYSDALFMFYTVSKRKSFTSTQNRKCNMAHCVKCNCVHTYGICCATVVCIHLKWVYVIPTGSMWIETLFTLSWQIRLSSQTVGQVYLLSYGEHTGLPSVLLFYVKVEIKENNFLQLILQILKSGKILAKITYVKLYQTFVMSVLV